MYLKRIFLFILRKSVYMSTVHVKLKRDKEFYIYN